MFVDAVCAWITVAPHHTSCELGHCTKYSPVQIFFGAYWYIRCCPNVSSLPPDGVAKYQLVFHRRPRHLEYGLENTEYGICQCQGIGLAVGMCYWASLNYDYKHYKTLRSRQTLRNITNTTKHYEHYKHFKTLRTLQTLRNTTNTSKHYEHYETLQTLRSDRAFDTPWNPV